MENIQEILNRAIECSKLEYISDIEWYYSNVTDTDKVSIMFSTDNIGKNSVDEFAVCHNNIWIEITPTNEQIKKMFKMLNDTPYREQEKFSTEQTDFEYYGNGYQGKYGL